MAKRKPTKEEAKRRIRELPNVPIPIRRLGPKGRALGIIGTGAKALAELLVDADPLDRTAPLPAKPLKVTRRTPESYRRRAQIVEGVRDVGRAIGDFRLPTIPKLNASGFKNADIATNTAARPPRLWKPATSSGIAVIGILKAIKAPIDPPMIKKIKT